MYVIPKNKGPVISLKRDHVINKYTCLSSVLT